MTEDTCTFCSQSIPEEDPTYIFPPRVFCKTCRDAIGEQVAAIVKVSHPAQESWREWLKIERDEKGKVTRVKLPLTPAEWVACCSREGEHYLGGCCGTMGRAQDHLNAMFRDGMASAKDLYHWYEYVRHHDGYNAKDLPVPAETAATDPIVRILTICEEIQTEGAWKQDWSDALLVMDPSKDLDYALLLLEKHSWWLQSAVIFRKGEGEDAVCHDAEELVKVAQLLPAVKTVFEKLQAAYPKTIEGYGVVSRKTGEIAKTWMGLAIWGSVERCQELLKTPEDVEEFEIRPVRVSATEGLVILEK